MSRKTPFVSRHEAADNAAERFLETGSPEDLKASFSDLDPVAPTSARIDHFGNVGYRRKRFRVFALGGLLLTAAVAGLVHEVTGDQNDTERIEGCVSDALEREVDLVRHPETNQIMRPASVPEAVLNACAVEA